MRVVAFAVASACLLVGCSDNRGSVGEEQRNKAATAIANAYDDLASCGDALHDLHMVYVGKHDGADLYANAFGAAQICNRVEASGLVASCSKVAPVGAEIAQRVMDAAHEGRDEGPVDDQYTEALSRCYADEALSQPTS